MVTETAKLKKINLNRFWKRNYKISVFLIFHVFKLLTYWHLPLIPDSPGPPESSDSPDSTESPSSADQLICILCTVYYALFVCRSLLRL